jgi:predicted TIM-barrel fold metal-dependent hydrolase
VIVDAHCHAGTGDLTLRGAGPAAPLRDYVHRASRAGITRTVLFASPGVDYTRANRQVAHIVRRHPRRFLGFVFINPVHDHGRIAAIVDEAVDHWGFRGIKVHWSDGQITPEIAEAARRRRLPVLYDPRGETGIVETAARAYPDVSWIIPHLSSFADDWHAQTAFIEQLVRLPNVFTDTSGVRYFDLLADAARRAGPHKILFGTDGPFLHPAVELAKVDALDLDEPGRELVLGGNLRRLIGRVRRS